MNINQEIELTPEKAQDLCKKGWVLNWKGYEKHSGNHEHSEGEPKIRKYLVLGQSIKAMKIKKDFQTPNKLRVKEE